VRCERGAGARFDIMRRDAVSTLHPGCGVAEGPSVMPPASWRPTHNVPRRLLLFATSSSAVQIFVVAEGGQASLRPDEGRESYGASWSRTSTEDRGQLAIYGGGHGVDARCSSNQIS
jgi:hypothetical protein